jgi:hypothetical protein
MADLEKAEAEPPKEAPAAAPAAAVQPEQIHVIAAHEPFSLLRWVRTLA